MRAAENISIKMVARRFSARAPPGSCGPRVRNVSSYVGLPRCPQALVDSKELARKIDERFFNVVLPTKLKIAVSACPNSCAKSQVNDLGVMAAAQPRIDPDNCDARTITSQQIIPIMRAWEDILTWAYRHPLLFL